MSVHSSEAPASEPGPGGLGVGTVLEGRYELVAHLASGGTAEVFRARDLKLGRDVAVKVLKDRATLNAAAQRFAAEAGTLARLSHPGIVTFLDAGTQGSTPYLVFELLDGTTLAAARGERTVESPRAGRILTDLADALAYAHAAGVIHRDVKPDNILIRSDHRAQLADFGVARLLDQTTTHTRTGQLVGSPAYLAPEQAHGQPVTAAVDVYALGLVTLELLTGQPQPTGTLAEIVAARTVGPELPHDLDPSWRALVAEMIDPDPLRRPTAGQVADRAARLPTHPFLAAEPPSDTVVLDQLPGPPPAAVPAATTVQAPVEGRGSAWVLKVEHGADRAWKASTAASQKGWQYSRRRIAELLDRLDDTSRPVLLVLGSLVLLLVVVALVADHGSDAPTRPAGQSQQDGRPGLPEQYRAPLSDLREAIRGDR